MINRKHFSKKRRTRICLAPMLVGNSVFELLEAMGGSRERGSLDGLWRNWLQVVGKEIGTLAKPAGYRGKTLLLAVEDSMQMQEIRMQGVDMLKKINNYLGKEFFTKIKTGLKKS